MAGRKAYAHLPTQDGGYGTGLAHANMEGKGLKEVTK